jgi:DNA-binding transcriptional regulator YiaG
MGKKNKKDKKKKHKEEDRSPGAVPSEKSGIKLDLRSVEIPPRPKPMKPSDIRGLRESLNASQTLFARLLNVSSNAVESWEQGLREPRQATLKLLHIARKNPDVLLSS